jgi:hypothetical protein
LLLLSAAPVIHPASSAPVSRWLGEGRLGYAGDKAFSRLNRPKLDLPAQQPRRRTF